MPFFKVKNYEIKRSSNNSTFMFVSKKGFTLIELLVVVAIMVILSTVMLASYTNFAARQEVKNAAAELKSDLRKYQTYALASQKNPYQIGDCVNKKLEYYSVLITPGDLSTPYDPDMWCWYGAVLYEGEFLVADHYPWTATKLTVAVGYRKTGSPYSCNSIKIFFKPLNYGLDLQCNTVPVSSWESAYIDLSKSSVTYRVNVTPSGDIYDEKH